MDRAADVGHIKLNNGLIFVSLSLRALIVSAVGAYFFCLIFGQEEGADEELASAPRMREIFQTRVFANLNYMIANVRFLFNKKCDIRVTY